MSFWQSRAKQADDRIEELKSHISWLELMGFTTRTKQRDGPWVDETDEHMGRERRALRTWQTIRARIFRDHGV